MLHSLSGLRQAGYASLQMRSAPARQDFRPQQPAPKLLIYLYIDS